MMELALLRYIECHTCLNGLAMIAQVGDKSLKDSSTKREQGFGIAKENITTNSIKSC